MILAHPRAQDAAGLLVVLLVGFAIHGWIAAWDLSTTGFTDSLDYLTMADFYRAIFHGGPLEPVTEYYRRTRFPPLFPLLVGVAGGGTEHHVTAAWVSNVIAVLAAASVWWWAKAERASTLVATLLALGLLLFPYHFLLNLTPITEPLGILLTASIFAILAREPLTRGRLLAAALLIGLAPLGRTALLPLCIAFVIWLGIRRPLPWRQLVLPVAAAWVPYVAWAAYRRLIGAQAYASHLNAQQYADAGMHWPSALWEQPQRVFVALVDGWSMPSSTLAIVVSGLLLLLAAIGCLLRLRRNTLDSWFLLGYLALILIWPYPSEYTRFLLAVYPCLLVCAVEGASAIDRRLTVLPRHVPATATLLVLGIVLTTLPVAREFWSRARVPVDTELLGEKREAIFFRVESDTDAVLTAEIFGRARILLREARQRVPQDACIYALPPQITRFYAQRRALEYPLGLGADPDDVRSKLPVCDFFFVGGWHSRLYQVQPLYPLQGLEGWTEPVLYSSVKVGNGEILAAALLVRKRDQVPAEHDGGEPAAAGTGPADRASSDARAGD